ncbi:peptidase domain-containing ABC transporter [Sphingomonas qomolangmaensis]|uniref:Peptidase domain-containing ABC transporter n=1 Tax=Sphingomonas qomolangmaensis TaxID=2918765 RepID=A0ABY5LAM6_9SPHN|nr:peptidase domain-containing ABC transporter [Sphingomonas qomolangmaensis]UUL84028.1 peptidase domain-containing ABC transporter [Sphingomonas qomolangmaensis]
MKIEPSPWLDFGLFNSFRLIRQAETSECGLACIAMIANHHGLRVEVSELRRTHEMSVRGSTARDLALTADRLGMSTRTVRCELEDLAKLRLPAIVHWDLGHFVVLHRVRGRKLFIADPSSGLRSYDMLEASPHFSGVAIEMAPAPHFQRQQSEPALSLRKLLRISPTLAFSFAQALLLSLLMQAALLAVPVYMQLVIDEGLQRGDRDILVLLLLAVIAVTCFVAIASFIRGLTVQFITQLLAFDMNSAVFHHLVRLPLSYFQKRQVGDLQQRFRSLLPIQQALGSGAVTGIIDGVLSLATAALMMVYSLPLALCVLMFVTLPVLIRLLSLSASRNAAGMALAAEAREQTRFLETLRAIATIKVNAAETPREDFWRSSAASNINAQVKRGNILQVTGAINQLIAGLGDAIIIFLGARMVLAGELTIGVLTAFIAYKQLFASRVTAFTEQVITFTLLDVQLERVADIVTSPREAKIDEHALEGEVIRGDVELRDVSFRYSGFDPLILDNVNLSVAAGEFVAITGPSGGGKSTLLRLLIGLSQPTSGMVLIDGKPLATWGPRPIRAQVSFVMQDDQLFAGTLLDNITLFASDPDMERVRAAVCAAAIEEEVAAMPMGLGSLIGDMGSLLSGGQKQRILIARALYRQPRILIMDEGTSHLDIAREAAINAAIRKLDVTRIVVAHRPETIRAADRVLELTGRCLRLAA